MLGSIFKNSKYSDDSGIVFAGSMTNSGLDVNDRMRWNGTLQVVKGKAGIL